MAQTTKDTTIFFSREQITLVADYLEKFAVLHDNEAEAGNASIVARRMARMLNANPDASDFKMLENTEHRAPYQFPN